MLSSSVAFTAFLGNTLILLSLHKESSLHAPSKLLFRSLATTDLCVGIISEPLCVAYLITALNERWYMICHYALAILETTGHILGLASLFTLAAISVDRLLALLLGLRYRQVVTLRRIYLIVTVSWIISTAGTTTYFWNHRVTLLAGFIVIALCVITSIFSYTKIFLTLRRNLFQVQGHVSPGHPSQTVRLNIARSKKNSVQRALGAVSVSCLFSAICYLGGFVPSERNVVIHCRR